MKQSEEFLYEITQQLNKWIKELRCGGIDLDKMERDMNKLSFQIYSYLGSYSLESEEATTDAKVNVKNLQKEIDILSRMLSTVHNSISKIEENSIE